MTRLTQRLVLVGGGHAHVQVLRNLSMNPLRGVQTILIASESQAPYSGMLPGYLAGWYRQDEIHFDLRKLCEPLGVRFVHGKATRIDTQAKKVFINDYPEISYDVCSVNVGIQPSRQGIQPGGKLISLKPISQLMKQWDRFLEQAGSARRIAIVGGGAAGTEVALCLGVRFDQAEVHLFHSNENLLTGHPPAAAARMERALKSARIRVRKKTRVASATPEGLLNFENTSETFDWIFWATQAAAPTWFEGLPRDSTGFLKVNRQLQAVGVDHLFGAGDCISIEGENIPKAGVYAVREGKVLTKNLRRRLKGQPLVEYVPQKTILALINSGDRRALAIKGNWISEGALEWKFKDRIDRRFMRRFSQPMQMPMDIPMLCGGCGSKVGATCLTEALNRNASTGAFEDAATISLKNGTRILQTVDAFERLIEDPYLFGQIAVHHSLNDLYAMGAVPEAVQLISQVPKADARIVADDLAWMIAGARKVLQEEEIFLAGGHSIQSDHFGMGVIATASANENAISKSTGKSGDILLLTQPLGSGIHLAALKRGYGNGGAFEKMLAEMLRSKRGAMQIARRHQATALTDISGFGLAGHLSEMGPRFEIDWKSLPLYPGTASLIKQGIQSSLAPDNTKAFLRLFKRTPETIPERASVDPQTAGGLLMTIPEDRAAEALEDLSEIYPHARQIGKVL